MTLRERERQLVEEVNMRRIMDNYTQRQVYRLVKGEDELKRINQIQLEELARLSSKMKQMESNQSNSGTRFAVETVHPFY